LFNASILFETPPYFVVNKKTTIPCISANDQGEKPYRDVGLFYCCIQIAWALMGFLNN
jgi:hypothetical protein